ncbi:hypothetical protein IWQ52_000865 [Labrenzia sp. EL_159]|nr:hypothetical protein [Labrenzia sp. EL_159]
MTNFDKQSSVNTSTSPRWSLLEMERDSNIKGGKSELNEVDIRSMKPAAERFRFSSSAE